MSYVYERVSLSADSGQTPHFGFIHGDGDFIFSSPGISDLFINSQPLASLKAESPAHLAPLIDQVSKLLGSREPNSRIYAIEQLYGITVDGEGKRVAKSFGIHAVKDPDEKVQAEALYLLCDLCDEQDTDVAPILLEKLRSENATVRDLAASCIGHIGKVDGEILEVLIEALCDVDSWVVESAALALQSGGADVEAVLADEKFKKQLKIYNNYLA